MASDHDDLKRELQRAIEAVVIKMHSAGPEYLQADQDLRASVTQLELVIGHIAREAVELPA